MYAFMTLVFYSSTRIYWILNSIFYFFFIYFFVSHHPVASLSIHLCDRAHSRTQWLYASGDYVHKRTGVEIERRCARSKPRKPRMTSRIEHVCVYDVSFLFFYKNLLDFKFNLVQSKDEMENHIRIGFSCSIVQQQHL